MRLLPQSGGSSLLITSLLTSSSPAIYSQLPSSEVSLIASVGGPRAAVYGEVTDRGFRSLAQHVGLNENDVFVDLGSGDGLAVLQAVAEFGARRSVGIELAESHHIEALRALHASPEHVRSRAAFFFGDAAGSGAGRLLANATVVFCNNLMFGDELQRRLAKRIADSGGELRVLVTTMPFPEGVPGLDAAAAPLMCDVSWDIHGDGHPCTIYWRAQVATGNVPPGTSSRSSPPRMAASSHLNLGHIRRGRRAGQSARALLPTMMATPDGQPRFLGFKVVVDDSNGAADSGERDWRRGGLRKFGPLLFVLYAAAHAYEAWLAVNF